MTRLNLSELAARSAAAGVGVSGFVSRQQADAVALKELQDWLLGQCESQYFLHYLRGGLQHWSRRWEYPYVLSQVARWISSRADPAAPCTLFDNACGVNATAYLLATAGHHLIGTDLGDQPSAEGDLPSSAWSHPDLAAVGGSLHFQTADSLALPFPDAHFDGSYSISSLEHMPDPIQAVREMIRVTRPGGLVTFTMDVAPCPSAVADESQVNRSNFADLQALLASSTDFFSPPCFMIPDDALSWRQDCRRSSGLRAAAGQLRRRLVGQPETPDFHVFGGAYIKRS
ncbi:class I SAM-dependent methyltransferase [Synechococcus sp. Tobar12-5m-g]|uniref:class I SAM-dependent methyltransferase n=1 Tax=unclassified Synechococcus TaxID=2626047 RepID=UPI0020CECF4C|nr:MULTISPECIES: class I SAM-dependent methyltransferase [unclassified Synechococcus]MCP9773906.1 class I SAM-dependent methyltransferase [Synechococcus sp. Tobar12-5m-g]MCP9874884.1 class I SAM-dependent methyltransferase [Synechococcus sp. Cruz CV-v-12]